MTDVQKQKNQNSAEVNKNQRDFCDSLLWSGVYESVMHSLLAACSVAKTLFPACATYVKSRYIYAGAVIEVHTCTYWRSIQGIRFYLEYGPGGTQAVTPQACIAVFIDHIYDNARIKKKRS